MFLVEIATLCLKDRFLKMFTSQTTVSYCFHCTKNEVFHYRFLRFPADLVTFTEEIYNRKLHFLCSVFCSLLIGLLIFMIFMQHYWECYLTELLFDLHGWLCTASYFQTLTYLRNKYFYPCKLISHEKMCKMCIHT